MKILFLLIASTLSNLAFSESIILKKSNTITLTEGFTFGSVNSTINDILIKQENNEELYLVIDSPGGSVEAGLSLIEVMKGSKVKIHTICIFCASMGFQAFQYATGNRLILDSGVLMAHKASGSFSGEFPGQLDSRYSFYKTRIISLDMNTIQKSNGKLTLKSFQDLYENEYWCQGIRCGRNGLIDRVVTVSCDKSLLNTYTTKTSTLFGEFTVSKSECPLIRGVLNSKSNTKKINDYWFSVRGENLKW